jgi:hypothetical protein
VLSDVATGDPIVIVKKKTADFPNHDRTKGNPKQVEKGPVNGGEKQGR